MESIERYKELRAALRSLNNRLLDCFSSGARAKEQITATARELGYKVEGGNILFATEDAKHRLWDFLIYEARNKGKSLAQRFLETGPDLPPDEEMLLRAAAASKASLYRIVDVNKPSAQVRMHDLLCERPDVLVTDIHMSSSCKCRYLFFDRFLETPDAAMCSGAGISFLPEDEPLLLKKYKRVEKVGNPALRILKCYALFFEMEKQSGIKTYYA